MNARRHARSRTGFTLIELMVVVAIITVLLSILLPSLSKARQSAKDTQCMNRLRSVFIATATYVDEDGRIPDLNNEPNEGTLQYNYLIYDGRDFDENFGPLARPYGAIQYTEQLYCPVQEDPFHSFATGLNPWPVKEGFDTRAGYGRRHNLSGKTFEQFTKMMAFAADLMHVPEVVLSAHKNGLNVVYIDGHAEWVPAFKDLLDNDLASPFDPQDNDQVRSIWHRLDEAGR